jgi:hypothetical protein
LRVKWDYPREAREVEVVIEIFLLHLAKVLVPVQGAKPLHPCQLLLLAANVI